MHRRIGDGTGNINLRCNEENKKLIVSGDTIDIVDNGPLNTILYLNNGSTVELAGTTITSAMISSYKSTLVGVEVGSTVTSIGSKAFSGCKSLSAITIPDSVTSIGSSAFLCGSGSYDGSLQSITVGETVYNYNGYSPSFSITLGNGTNVWLAMWTSIGGGGGSND